MNYIEELSNRIPSLAGVAEDIEKAVEAICRMHREGGKLLLCGNGGSAADCEHISGELLKGFLLERPPVGQVPGLLQQGVAAIPLPSLAAASTAYSNDVAPSLVFAQLTYALGRSGDVFMGLSTSGNSQNVVEAARVAKAQGLLTIALVGAGGGKLADICHVVIRAPEMKTPLIQELHLPIYHAICAEVEARLFGKR